MYCLWALWWYSAPFDINRLATIDTFHLIIRVCIALATAMERLFSFQFCNIKNRSFEYLICPQKPQHSENYLSSNEIRPRVRTVCSDSDNPPNKGNQAVIKHIISPSTAPGDFVRFKTETCKSWTKPTGEVSISSHFLRERRNTLGFLTNCFVLYRMMVMPPYK